MSQYLYLMMALLLAFANSVSWAGKVVANKPPTVSITSPLSGASFSAPAVVALSATAADTDGTIAKVAFYQGTTLIGTSTNPASPYGVTWSNVAAGTYSLTAKATDNSGATTTSAAVSITVGATNNIGISSPANGATVYGDSVTVTGTFVGDATSTTVWLDNGNSTRLAELNGNTFSATLPLYAGTNTVKIAVVRRDNTSDAASMTITGSSYPLVAFHSPTTATFAAPPMSPWPSMPSVQPARLAKSVSSTARPCYRVRPRNPINTCGTISLKGTIRLPHKRPTISATRYPSRPTSACWVPM